MKPRLLLADDHEIVLSGFRKLLAPSFDIVGSVTDGQSLVQAASELKPDLIVVDLAMPRLNGLDAIERIRAGQPRARLLVLTMQNDPDTAAEAIRRGALGYILKSSPVADLFDAIKEVLAGRIYVSSAITQGPPGAFAAEVFRGARGAALTLRQREVLQLIAEGRSMKEAAQILNISARTVAFHKYSMMEQLGFTSTAQLIQHAVALGLVNPAQQAR